MTQPYRLTRVDDDLYPYRDQDGVSWESPEDWLFVGIMGGCGCGNCDEFGKRAAQLIRGFGEDGRHPSPVKGETDEILAHWMDSRGLLEHGTSIYGSWLSPKGRNVHEQLIEHAS